METLLDQLGILGPLRWLIDFALLPAFAVLFVFSIRGALVHWSKSKANSEDGVLIPDKFSRTIAVLLSVVAVAWLWLERVDSFIATFGLEGKSQALVLDWTEGAIYVLAATCLFWLVFSACQRGLRLAIVHLTQSKVGDGVKLQGAEVVSRNQIRHASVLALKVLRTAILLVLLYFYVPAVLGALPPTRSLADRAIPVMMDPVVGFWNAFVDYVPRLIGAILILVAVHYLLKIVTFVMGAVRRGAIRIPGFDPEWADQTNRLMKIVIVLGTVMVIYPFLPGAGSEVFKGFSIFIGALFTLGASSTVNNLISGIILTYTGSFHMGDRLRIGSTIGDVVGRGLFVTRVRTLENEEVVIPNNVALSGQVTNYSAAKRVGGLVVTVNVGLGYDVDWREVHRLLKEAASKTDAIKAHPEAFVVQDALGDFAVSYQLRGYTDEVATAMRVRSELRQNALDAFHEAGIEIMTPDVHALRNAPNAVPGAESEAALPPPFRLAQSSG